MPITGKISDVIAQLQRKDPEAFVLCSLWYEADVHALIPMLSTTDAHTVLQIAAKDHDATVGIHWDALTSAFNTVFPHRSTNHKSIPFSEVTQ